MNFSEVQIEYPVQLTRLDKERRVRHLIELVYYNLINEFQGGIEIWRSSKQGMGVKITFAGNPLQSFFKFHPTNCLLQLKY